GRCGEALMCRASAAGLGRETERPERARLGEVDRHGDGDAERDAEDGQTALPRVRAELPHGQTRELTAQHAGSSMSAPRCTLKIRSATATTSRLCVAINTVRP